MLKLDKKRSSFVLLSSVIVFIILYCWFVKIQNHSVLYFIFFYEIVLIFFLFWNSIKSKKIVYIVLTAIFVIHFFCLLYVIIKFSNSGILS